MVVATPQWRAQSGTGSPDKKAGWYYDLAFILHDINTRNESANQSAHRQRDWTASETIHDIRDGGTTALDSHDQQRCTH
jgi:hypothetical protein